MAAAPPTGGQAPNTLAEQQTPLTEQQNLLAQQNQQFQQRAAQIDQDNQDLEARLAQSLQQSQLLKDEIVATREQLRSVSKQLQESLALNEDLKQRSKVLSASVGKRNQAVIRPNSSILRELSVGNLPGVEVRQDGDVVRVEIPAEQLFHPGSAYVKKGAAEIIRAAAGEIGQKYPNQIVGVEGHTDSQVVRMSQYNSNHHLSFARALAVYELIAAEGHLPPENLFVTAHGPNQPVVSNATPTGQERNRRIELVIYPESARR